MKRLLYISILMTYWVTCPAFGQGLSSTQLCEALTYGDRAAEILNAQDVELAAKRSVQIMIFHNTHRPPIDSALEKELSLSELAKNLGGADLPEAFPAYYFSLLAEKICRANPFDATNYIYLFDDVTLYANP